MSPDRTTAALSPEGEGAARAFFGDRLGLAEEYARQLATTGVEYGLLGPREVPRLWDRHLLNCAAVAELVPAGVRVADVGSGAGLPGIVLAIARPDLALTLVEPLLRRAEWLTGVVEELGLDGVSVRRARAEELVGSLVAEVAVARAVAPLGRLAGWCVPLVEAHGMVLALKGRSAAEELQRDSAVLTGLGVVGSAVLQCGVGVLEEPTTVIRLDVGDSPGGSRPAPGSGRQGRVTGGRGGSGRRRSAPGGRSREGR